MPPRHLVGPRQRGLAMGLNEAAGYTAAGVTALARGFIASTVGLRPQPFWLGIAYVAAGLVLSPLLVHDTHPHARREARMHHGDDAQSRVQRSTGWVVAETSWRDRTAFGASLADRIGRKPLIVAGMLVQAVGLAVIGPGGSRPFLTGMAGSALLGDLVWAVQVAAALTAGARLIAWRLMSETLVVGQPPEVVDQLGRDP